MPHKHAHTFQCLCRHLILIIVEGVGGESGWGWGGGKSIISYVKCRECRSNWKQMEGIRYLLARHHTLLLHLLSTYIYLFDLTFHWCIKSSCSLAELSEYLDDTVHRKAFICIICMETHAITCCWRDEMHHWPLLTSSWYFKQCYLIKVKLDNLEHI